MTRLRWFLGIGILLGVAALPTCFHFSHKEIAHPVVVLRDSALRPFEVELKKTVEISGDMHSPSMPFSRPSVFEKSDWLYVDTDKGVINASEIVFTHWRVCPESAWWQANMRGTIEFLGPELVIQLEMPRYDDNSSIPTRYVAWEHNGKYRIERSVEPAVPVNDDNCGM